MKPVREITKWNALGAIFCLGIGLPFASFVSCVTTPETHRTQINIVPDAQMNAMGMEAYDGIRAKEKISQNEKQKTVVMSVGKVIAEASEKNYNWDFTLFDEPKTINAFCLPGGKVGVYSGILPVTENEAGLAAVMGHEVAHAVLRHGAERISQTVLMQLGIALASLSFKDEKQQGLIAAAMGVGMQFGVMLPFSRKHELEADEVGLKYMAKAGYDPKEAVYFWERMSAVGGSRSPAILSTHPDSKSRAKALEKQIAEVKPLYDASKKKPSTKIPL